MEEVIDLTWDIEASGLLNNTSIDYTQSPYKLKEDYKVHSVVVEEHKSGVIHAFYNGETIVLDGSAHVDSYEGFDCSLLEYTPVEYVHHQLDEFPKWIKTHKIGKVIAHNQINYDLLACKLKFGMDYTIEQDSWCEREADFIDTMVLSKTLNPDLAGGHSLDNLGTKCGRKKVEFRKHIPVDHRFKHFSADMLYYNIVDVTVNTAVYRWLEKQKGSWNYSDAFSLEKSVQDIITRQEHRGFHFDYESAVKFVNWLDIELERLETLVTPILPMKPLAKTNLAKYTPAKTQFLKNGEPHNSIKSFVEKHGGTWVGEKEVEIFGKRYTLPMPLEPIVTHAPMELKDSTQIKGWLIREFGWNPQSYKERDLTVNAKKIKLDREGYEAAVKRYVEQTLGSPFERDRVEHLEVSARALQRTLLSKDTSRPVKVLTNPVYTVGMEKEICPDLVRLSEQFPFAKDIVNYLTYKHRRSSILGGDFDPDDDDDEPSKGWMSAVRDDGRIPTPADTCGAATSRFKHRVVCNVPRVTSLYGHEMRSLFGADKDCVLWGYDFDSLISGECKTY